MRKRVRTGVAATIFWSVIALCGLGSPGRAIAQEQVYQNDDLGSDFNGTATLLALATGEIYAATLTPPASDFPLELVAIEVVFVNSCDCQPNSLCTGLDPACEGLSDPSERPIDCGQFHVLIWEDTGESTPGPLLFSTENLGEPTPVEIPANSKAKQRIDLADLGASSLMVTSGRIRIGLKAANPACVLNQGTSNQYPVLMTDGGVETRRNWVYGSNGVSSGWFDAADLGIGSISGDFVLRLVAKPSNVSPGDDASQLGDTTADTSQPAPVITAVSPSWGYPDQATEITILGSNFSDLATVSLGQQPIGVKSVVGGTLITATVPAGLVPGFYDLIVHNSDGQSTTKVAGYEVRARGTQSGDVTTPSDATIPDVDGAANTTAGGGSSCQSAHSPIGDPSSRGAMLVLFAAIVGLAWRRRLEWR
ncbi:MAG: IPT/TIG domain-containing protein [Myxococcales bacterium]|nr:IPT/TIG domain-containing protein [Myxococcales bacterium]